MGDDIKKLNVTPNGRPAVVNPIKIGIEEQEQKGVTVPSKAATTRAPKPPKRAMMCLLRSGGKYDWMYDMKNISTRSNIVIFTTS